MGVFPIRYKVIIICILCSLTLFFTFHTFSKKQHYIPVFNILAEPAAITSGVTGSALTVNIAFGDTDVEQWVEQLQEPYPLLFIDIDWAERYPSLIETMIEKNITTGLLGAKGRSYIDNTSLLNEQIIQYEKIFQSKPLWFRTTDEKFPPVLLNDLDKHKINALGSSLRWTGKPITLKQEGEIISVSSYKNQQVNFDQLQQFMNDASFTSIDQVLFNLQSKKKKIPK